MRFKLTKSALWIPILAIAATSSQGLLGPAKGHETVPVPGHAIVPVPSCVPVSNSVSLQTVSSFHLKLNKICFEHKAAMDYCGPLGATGRALALSDRSNDLYRWVVLADADHRGLAPVIFHLRLTAHKPSGGDFTSFNESNQTYYVVLETKDYNPEVRVKQLNGKSPKEFLSALTN